MTMKRRNFIITGSLASLAGFIKPASGYGHNLTSAPAGADLQSVAGWKRGMFRYHTLILKEKMQDFETQKQITYLPQAGIHNNPVLRSCHRFLWWQIQNKYDIIRFKSKNIIINR